MGQQKSINSGDIFAQIRDEILASPCATAIISSEDFEAQHSKEKIKFIADQFSEFDTRILVFLRRQDEFIEAEYNQNLKMGKYFKSIQAFTELMFNGGRCDFYGLCEAWAAEFGRANILVRIYAKTFNVIADFFEAIEIYLRDDLPTGHINPSFDKRFTALVRMANQALINEPTKWRALMQLVMRASTENGASHGSYSLLTVTQRKEIIERCNGENAKIAQIYLSQESLFPDTFEIADFVDEHCLNEAALASILPHLASALKI